MPKILAVLSVVILKKIVLLNSQGSAATQSRSGGKYYLCFVGKFMRFAAVKKM